MRTSRVEDFRRGREREREIEHLGWTVGHLEIRPLGGRETRQQQSDDGQREFHQSLVSVPSALTSTAPFLPALLV